MSRAIKFRFWDTYYKEMLYRDLYFFEEQGIRAVPDVYSKLYEVMQYIGIKDSKGIDIYEGDILSFDDDKSSYRAVVDYVHDGFKLRPVNGMIPNIDFEHWTIIGNVYEHNELLNRSNKAC